MCSAYSLKFFLRNKTILRVYGDQISGWYHTQMSHNGRSNMYNWKGYKTPFRRSGHKYKGADVLTAECWCKALSDGTILKCYICKIWNAEKYFRIFHFKFNLWLSYIRTHEWLFSFSICSVCDCSIKILPRLRWPFSNVCSVLHHCKFSSKYIIRWWLDSQG